MSSQQLTEEQRKQLEEKLKNMSPEQLREFQKQQCIFCQIINGKVSSKKVYEDETCLAVLDINPAEKGHLLIIPKEHYAIMPQLPDEALGHLFFISRHLSQILLKTLKAEGTNLFIANGPAAGQRAQHFMIHLIPRKKGDGILGMEEKLIDKEMVEKIKSAVEERIKEALGGKNLESKKDEGKKEIKQAEEKPKKEESKEPEKFITSETAKRFHKERCAFAQNIPEDKKIVLDEKEAFESEKKPCACVTGRKILLKEDKGGDKKPPRAKKKKEDAGEEKKEEDVSLDDIAEMFK